jgi:hypothetical protein
MFMMCSRNAATAAAIHQLLLVPFDDGGRAHLGLIRILAELAPRVSLPQQIPHLIELDLDGFQPYLILIGQFALPVEMLLLVNETFDLLQNGVIGRRSSHINHLADFASEYFSRSLMGFGSMDGGSLAGNDCSMVVECGFSPEPVRSGRVRPCKAAEGSMVMHASQRLPIISRSRKE